MKPRILIVEDCTVTRERIQRAIEQEDRFDVIGSVGDYQSGHGLLLSEFPDILLTDLDLPDGNGVDLIKMLALPEVTTKLAIVISIFGDGRHVIDAIKAGASGYLLKDDDYMDINDAITQMLNGGAPISPSIARHLLTELKSESNSDGDEEQEGLLSSREHEVLVLVSKGYSTKEIAQMMNLSYHTVKEYISNIYKKLAVNNRMQAVNEALMKGII